MYRIFTFIFLIFSVSILHSQNFDPIKNESWLIEELAIKDLVNTEIDYFTEKNVEDSLPKMKLSDNVIVIISKKNTNEILELWYGTQGDFQVLSDERLKWVLPNQVRKLILKKDYFYITDDSFLTGENRSSEVEFLKKQFFWTNRDVYLSSGSRFILDRMVFRVTNVAGRSVQPVYAASVRIGDVLLGFPGDAR